MAEAKVTISVEKVPEVIHAVMRQFSNLLRKEAGTERNPYTAKRLRDIAAKFETGQQ